MTHPQEPVYMVTDRQLRALRNVYALGDGWPFGDGPLQWFCHTEIREGTVQMVCDACPQSVFTFGQYMAERGFTWNLELLKARVADHVLKVHPEAATSPVAGTTWQNAPAVRFAAHPEVHATDAASAGASNASQSQP